MTVTPTPPMVEPSVYTDVCTYKGILEDHMASAGGPSIHWCQLGSPVLTCESWAVGTTGVRTEALFPFGGNECQMMTIIDLIAAVARECNFEADENGFTEPSQVMAASVQQDADTTALMRWAEGLPRPPLALTSVQYSSEGGLAITTLTTSAYSGWT